MRLVEPVQPCPRRPAPVRTTRVALALFVSSATLVALTEQVPPGMLAGAVYSPKSLTVPQFVPATDQVTAGLPLPLTVAVNCCTAFVCTVADVGEIATFTTAPAPFTV